MNVLIVGSGGREHALAWKIGRSPRLGRLIAAPGNVGMASLCEVRNVAVDDVEGLTALAREVSADLVVVGPEASLAAGLADRLTAQGHPCFGPTQAAARLESSKVFLKDFAARRGLPTARHVSVASVDAARRALEEFDPPYVLKADGLAAGKGVVLAETRGEAERAIEVLMGGGFGAAGGRLVLEAFLTGEEASLFALCDGADAMLFGGAQDHKRIFDGDLGPNTGGMGAYSPAPVLSAVVAERALQSLILPTLAGMAQEGAPYRGVLYAGLMIEAGQPSLVEFNARFGDPECQALMLRLESDLLPYLAAAAGGSLKTLAPPTWRPEASICVVVAAPGYPQSPRRGGTIRGWDQDFGEDVVVFHAGTALSAAGELTAAGGRVLNVCARGPDLTSARERAYEALSRIDWPQGVYRTDIGWRGLGI